MKIVIPGIIKGSLSSKYSCDGAGLSPAVDISGVPSSAKSLVLHVVDYDVPKDVLPSGTFHHWIVWNIDPATTTIAENSVPPGAILGQNTSGQTGWTPPCPPSGEHRYVFRLFALDAPLKLPAGTAAEKVLTAIGPIEITRSETTGRYRRR